MSLSYLGRMAPASKPGCGLTAFFLIGFHLAHWILLTHFFLFIVLLVVYEYAAFPFRKEILLLHGQFFQFLLQCWEKRALLSSEIKHFMWFVSRKLLSLTLEFIWPDYLITVSASGFSQLGFLEACPISFSPWCRHTLFRTLVTQALDKLQNI